MTLGNTTLGNTVGTGFRKLQLEAQKKQNKLLDLQIEMQEINIKRAKVSLDLLKHDNNR